MKTETRQALIPDSDDSNNEYVLRPGRTGTCWITVGKRSVHVVRRNGTLKVAIYPLGQECDEPLAQIETSLK